LLDFRIKDFKNKKLSIEKNFKSKKQTSVKIKKQIRSAKTACNSNPIKNNLTMKTPLGCLSILFIILLNSHAPVYADRGMSVSAKKEKPEQKNALVIGNADYKVGPLKNPVNDARDVARVIKKKGFNVTLLTNTTRRQMKLAIKKFGGELRKGGVGLFFYAGHGMQVNGVNYLIPIGAHIQEEDEIEFEAVESNLVLKKMDSAGNRLNMVFLDACRDNPFARSFRSSTKGLAAMDAPSGTLVAFATAPGRTAADGDGKNGLFTGHLIRHMETPGLPLTKMMMMVRKDVLRDSKKKQTPWDVSSLTGDFYFSGEEAKGFASLQNKPGQTQTLDAEEVLWSSIQSSSDINDYQDYLRNYPAGRFTATAQIKIRRLKKKMQDQDNRIIPKHSSIDTNVIFYVAQNVHAESLIRLNDLFPFENFKELISSKFLEKSKTNNWNVIHFKEAGDFIDKYASSKLRGSTESWKFFDPRQMLNNAEAIRILKHLAITVVELGINDVKINGKIVSTQLEAIAYDISTGKRKTIFRDTAFVGRQANSASMDLVMMYSLINDAYEIFDQKFMPKVVQAIKQN
jgi:Caspase domain